MDAYDQRYRGVPLNLLVCRYTLARFGAGARTLVHGTTSGARAAIDAIEADLRILFYT